MTRGLLAFREFSPKSDGNTGTIVALHGSGGDLDQLIPLCRAAAPSFQVVAPDAPRPMSRRNSGLPYTAEFIREYKGYHWYPIESVGYPEPSRFGDSLWLAEQFVIDVVERHGSDSRPVFLLGYEEGAVLAVTMAGIMPEYLAGIVGIGGYLPEIRGWLPPVEDLSGLPVLLVHDPDDQEMPAALIEKTVDDLGRRGATVKLQLLAEARRSPLAAAGALREWLDIQLLSRLTSASYSGRTE